MQVPGLVCHRSVLSQGRHKGATLTSSGLTGFWLVLRSSSMVLLS